MKSVIPTQFAPAERATPAVICRQGDAVRQNVVAEKLPNTIPALLMILNAQRQIVYANQSVLKLLNIRKEACLDGLRPGEALNCAHAVSAEHGCGTTAFCRTCGAVNAILNAQQGRPDARECRITDANGNAMDLRVWTTPMEVNHDIFVAFALMDIRDEKRRLALEHIFFHDIMNVAAGLRGFSELLIDGQPEDNVRFQRIIHDLAENLIENIQAQRDLINAENNELLLNPVKLQTKAVVMETVSMCQSLSDAKKVVTSVAIEAQDVAFTSDKRLLHRVLGNMVKNAVEASQPGEVVTVNCGIAGEHIFFTVHNPAVLPDEVKLQLFQRSFSTKGAGRGLGTYSIKLLTERYLKGTVNFISEEKTGTVFKVRYPVNLPDTNVVSKNDTNY